jgi:hypothetical protein
LFNVESNKFLLVLSFFFAGGVASGVTTGVATNVATTRGSLYYYTSANQEELGRA